MAKFKSISIGKWMVSEFEYVYTSKMEKAVIRYIYQHAALHQSIQSLSINLRAFMQDLPYKQTVTIKTGPAAQSVSGRPIGEKLTITNHRRKCFTMIVRCLE